MMCAKPDGLAIGPETGTMMPGRRPGIIMAKVFLAGIFHETHALEVERVSIALPRLPSPFRGMTIAQLSDIHLGPLYDPRMERIKC